MSRQAGSCLSCSTLGSAGMQSRDPTNVQRALSRRLPNACTRQVADVMHGRASATKFLAASARAVRPASLATSARPQQIDPGSVLGSGSEPALSSKQEGTRSPMFGKAREALCEVTACSEQMQALRRSAKPNTKGRAGTSCCAARAGTFGLFANGATQRKM
jgi:hypothetical protein